MLGIDQSMLRTSHIVGHGVYVVLKWQIGGYVIQDMFMMMVVVVVVVVGGGVIKFCFT